MADTTVVDTSTERIIIFGEPAQWDRQCFCGEPTKAGDRNTVSLQWRKRDGEPVMTHVYYACSPAHQKLLATRLLGQYVPPCSPA